MGFPARHVTQFLHVLHFLQERDDVAHLLHHRRRQPGGIIALNEPLEPPVNDVPDRHVLA
jgi:hypothetical protein